MKKYILLSELKPYPNNPRKITKEKITELGKSIKDFEKMMVIRKIIIDENNVIIGGNQRYAALKELGYKEVPWDWVGKVSDLTEAEKKEFMIKDNSPVSGEWDFDILEDWDNEKLEDWGLDFNLNIKDISNISKISNTDYNNEMDSITDKEAKYPIVPDFMEKNECFIIIVNNEIDIAFIRNFFDLNKNFQTKDKKIRKSNVITIEDVRRIKHIDTNERAL